MSNIFVRSAKNWLKIPKLLGRSYFNDIEKYEIARENKNESSTTLCERNETA